MATRRAVCLFRIKNDTGRKTHSALNGRQYIKIQERSPTQYEKSKLVLAMLGEVCLAGAGSAQAVNWQTDGWTLGLGGNINVFYTLTSCDSGDLNSGVPQWRAWPVVARLMMTPTQYQTDYCHPH
ncbi:MAG: hypothetical protein KZQ86_05270 [Candidatus Thiodiazotropha sp. (ex Lucinoma kastoroae)]|nr:hypothetical protein [Candidatus Thiodiazotropha sp. (ex Lucinoma kastoroae)]